MREPIEATVHRVLLEYALDDPTGGGALASSLSIREDLGIDSLALVSAIVRLGDELGVADLERHAASIARVRTVGDFVTLGRALAGEAGTVLA